MLSVKELLEKLSEINSVELFIGGALHAQTLWNKQDGKLWYYGIEDIDIVYFDQDTSYEKEDKVIKEVERHLVNLDLKLDIKNQARVHLWSESVQVFNMEEAVGG